MRRRILIASMAVGHGLLLHLHALDLDSFRLNGYTSFEYERQLEGADAGPGDANGSFDTDLLDLVFNLRPADNLRVAMDITWEHGVASEDDFGNAAIEYGFVERTFSDAVRVRAGKMFTPFGVLNEIHTAKPAFLSVKEAAATNKPERIVDDARRFFPRWGAGIALRGNARVAGAPVEYDLMVANGEQDAGNPFEEDDNVAKSVTARLRAELAPTVTVGGSVYRDRPASDNVDAVTSAGGEFELLWNRVRVLGEVVVGVYDPVGNASVTQIGWFVQPSYHYESGVTPYVRVGRVDPNTDVDADHGWEVVTGVNWATSAHLMLKLEHNYVAGGKASSVGAYPGRDYNEIKAAIVSGF